MDAAIGSVVSPKFRYAIGDAKHYSRSHNVVIRVYDKADSIIETHEHAGEFGE